MTLFTGTWFRDPYGDISYDVARDGRFLMLRPLRGARLQVVVMLNWIEEVRARLDRTQREDRR